MNQIKLAQKFKILEREIGEIKRYLGFGISEKNLDSENWQKIKKISQSIRQKLFQERYPKPYVSLKKENKELKVSLNSSMIISVVLSFSGDTLKMHQF